MAELAMFLPEKLLPNVVERLADVCFESMYRGAPWRSGRLAMSIAKQFDGLSARVGPTVLYAKFVSEGTAPHQILPQVARALAFLGGDLGGLVFAKHVMHPGSRANPYVENAVAETQGQVFTVFQDVWAEL